METHPTSFLAAHQCFISGPEDAEVFSLDSHPEKDTQGQTFGSPYINLTISTV